MFKVGDLVRMEPVTRWKRDLSDKHGYLWEVVRIIYPSDDTLGCEFILRSLATGEVCPGFTNFGLYLLGEADVQGR